MKKSLSVLSILMAICLSACSGANTPSNSIPENSELSSETVISEISENLPEQSSKTDVSEISENSPEQSSETDVSEVSENSPEQSSQSTVSEVSENSPEQPSQSTVSEVSKNSPEQSSESTVSEISQQPQNVEYGSEVPTEWQDNGIFSEYYQKAFDKMRTMSLDEKIGQMFYSRCPQYDAVGFAQKYHLGGYVLFGVDFADKSKNEVKNNINSYINSQDIPMTIAVDEEGGTVVRISSKPALYDEEFQSPRDIYNEGGMNAIKENADAMAEMLKDFNIDVNFAPVCDISLNEYDFMYYRSIGHDVDTVCEFVSEFTKIAQENGVSATLKHFPGYGNNVDTHTGIAIDERPYEKFVDEDFKPFEAGIKQNAHLVMVSHNIVNCMDSTKPASLSKKVHDILRNELGFTGLAVTDDLEMDAITEYTNGQSPAVTAILAGNDMLTIGDTMIDDAVSSIKSAVSDGTLDVKLIDHAVTRILAFKYYKNMM